MTAALASTERLSRREIRLAKRRIAAFRAARRHTWLVKSLRVVLPSIALLMLGTYGALLYARIGIKVGSGNLKVGAMQITADDLKMKGVTYDGVTKDGGRYVVKARDAQVDILQKGPVALTGIDGDLVQKSGVATKLKSTRGILDNAKGEMDLFDGVDIDTTSGLKARMKSAKVFNKENRVIAKEGVDAETATGRIKSQTMDFETKARKGVFTGNVALRMIPSQSDTAASPLGGLGGADAKKPLDMTAQKLDFDDNARLAVLTGGVTAIQGDSQLTAQNMRVTYEGKAAMPGLPGLAPATKDSTAPVGEAAQTRLSKLNATGAVVITQGADRRIVAETLDVDVAADKAIFTGPNVEVQQGKNRLLGRRLEVDRKSGKSSLSSPAEGRTPAGRIKTTFVQDKAATGAPLKAARPAGSPPAETAGGGFMNFKTDPNAPIDIDAETLDVNDQAKQAVFRKAVRAQQGDFVIQSAELVAHYTGDTGLMTAADPQAAKGVKGASPQISRIDANNDVLITSKAGQEARGKKAVFDQKSNTVVLSGDVTVYEDRNNARASVVTGTQLRIDLTTGVARFDNDGSTPSIGNALPPATKEKSAPGPGGLPQVGGVQMPVAPAPVSAGRQSVTFYPDEQKKKQEENKTKKSIGDPDKGSKAVPKVAPQKSTTEGWNSTTSPSPVYRAP